MPENSLEHIHNQLSRQDQQLNRIEQQLNAVIRLVNGGNDYEKGLLTRVDRLQEADKRRTKVVWAALAASISSIVGLIFLKLFGH